MNEPTRDRANEEVDIDPYTNPPENLDRGDNNRQDDDLEPAIDFEDGEQLGGDAMAARPLDPRPLGGEAAPVAPPEDGA